MSARHKRPTTPREVPAEEEPPLTLEAIAAAIERSGGDAPGEIAQFKHLELLDSLAKGGFWRAANMRLERLIRATPEQSTLLPDLLRRRAMSAFTQGDQETYRSCIDRILSGPYGRTERAHLDLSMMYLDLGRYQEALEAASRAARINQASAWAAALCGRAAAHLTDYDAATGHYERATRCYARNPSEAVQRSYAWLILGQLGAFFMDHERRIDYNRMGGIECPDYWGPHWSGSPLRGRTLLVRAETGNGDIIQHSRFVRELQRFGGRVIFRVPPYLVGLMRASGIADEVVSTTDDVPHFDEHIMLESLGRVLAVELDTIPSADGYLVAPGGRVRSASSDRVRVGIAWAGSPDHSRDRNRSMSAAAFRRLIDLSPHVEWVSLMHPKHPRAGEAADRIGQPETPLGDYADTARLLTELDLLVSVDTSVAHLAGALGVPCWTLLSTGPTDARWMLRRTDTPWYRSMRLFRQSAPDDWMELVGRVAEALGRLNAATRAEVTSHVTVPLPPRAL